MAALRRGPSRSLTISSSRSRDAATSTTVKSVHSRHTASADATRPAVSSGQRDGRFSPVRTSTPVPPRGTLIRSSSRTSSSPRSAWRQALGKPGPSSASPSCSAIDGAWVSASTSPTRFPPRASSTASSMASVDRPGAPAGPQTAITRGCRGAAGSTAGARSTARASRSRHGSAASGHGPISPNAATRRSSAASATSGTMRTPCRSQSETAAPVSDPRWAWSTTVSAAATACAMRSASRPAQPSSAAVARARAGTTATTSIPSRSNPSASRAPSGSSAAMRTFTGPRLSSERRRGRIPRPPRRAPRRPPTGGSRVRALPSRPRSSTRRGSPRRRSRPE